jgi:hypothetical protein
MRAGEHLHHQTGTGKGAGFWLGQSCQDADPDIPILKQAKAEYAKLQ